MKLTKEKTAFFIIDFFAINLVWYIYFSIHIQNNFSEYWLTSIVLYCYWLIIFLFFGLYRSWYLKSRLDEFLVIVKAATFGTLFLFFAVWIDDINHQISTNSRMFIVTYWGLMISGVGISRMLLHSFHKKLLLSGVGAHPTLIIGSEKESEEMYQKLQQLPALGYDVKGIVCLEEPTNTTPQYLGTVENLERIIHQHSIKDIIITLSSSEHHLLINIINHCNDLNVSIKIVPDMYDIISGQARTNQIYGFPLIEIMPEIMQPWEESAKRLMDVIISSFILIVTLPISFIIGIAIKINSHGSIIFSQERVGKDGKIFKMYKFRSMYSDAEKETGPVWAPQNDTRVTKVGKFLRQTRLDEIPQFINVLDGDMSLVGPRPERPFFVEKLSKEIPLYKRRLKVRPGITGWAQIKQGYDRTIDDVRSKVRYDLFYIENMSIRMDLKILSRTLYTMLARKGN